MFPKMAYVLLWFPLASETFIFREVANLWKKGVPLKVFTLYGEKAKNLSPEMISVTENVERLGIPYLRFAPADLAYWFKRDRRTTADLLRTVPIRRWNGLEKGGENIWSFFAAFSLARRFEEANIRHIHAPWANGPATAAWIASKLTRIPFSFTARAWDIYPPDGALKEKIRDALFVRSETKANIKYLTEYSGADPAKFHLTYNGVPLTSHSEAPVAMKPPYNLLAIGRFVGKKGYDFLLQACRMLKESAVDFRLVLAGSGPRELQLKLMAKKMGLASRVHFPGFVPYDKVPELFRSADIFLMPSVIHKSGDRDGIPTVIMEALMHRVPVIATDVSGIGELIEDGITGLLIQEKNPAQIAEAVLKMINDRTGALKLAEAGRARVQERFDPEVNHEKVFRLYENL